MNLLYHFFVHLYNDNKTDCNANSDYLLMLFSDSQGAIPTHQNWVSLFVLLQAQMENLDVACFKRSYESPCR